jgi:hypothetical protein
MGNSEFNPTHKDLLNLDQKILELKSDKQKLIKSKLIIEGSLSIMQSKYRKIEFNSPEFFQIKEGRQKLKLEASNVELQIRKINEEILYKSKLKQEVEFHLKGKKYSEISSSNLVKQLISLKEKYNSFSKDKTRVSSMRIMASEIRDEIEKILKTLDN